MAARVTVTDFQTGDEKPTVRSVDRSPSLVATLLRDEIRTVEFDFRYFSLSST